MLKDAAAGLGIIACSGGQICLAQQRGGYGRSGGYGGGASLSISATNPSLQHNSRRCRSCGDCVNYCLNMTAVYGRPVSAGEEACIYCGQCTLFCRNNALSEKYHYPQVRDALNKKDRIVIASTSPAIRVALGEMFRMTTGTNVEGKIVRGLRDMGVHYVLDTTFAADLTVMEEASELVKRLSINNAPLPMFTSCCPAWVRYAKLFYPKLLPNISTTKSPVMMQGAMVKTYFAKQQGINPANIYHVALTPCTAKKAEILLTGMNASGVYHKNDAMRDVDVALTCRELGYLFNMARINLPQWNDATYDPVMGAGSGAGMIFGNTGGVTEAALRTAYWLINKEQPPQEFYELKPVRGLSGVRQATVDMKTRQLNFAVAHGIGVARVLLDKIQQGGTNFDFVEVMACPGGCIGGGGQPKNQSLNDSQLKTARSNALYDRDAKNTLRLSYENPEIKAIYANFLKEPLGELSEQLLHL
ncbi:MAG: [FeFe] hydrogenase, group A [Planctomycetaceae bacterium]|nr:[FeFe] hydrogenase, group A [Planctomycetaceae bacterium]